MFSSKVCGSGPRRSITPSELVRNWTWTLAGNLLGGIFFAWLLWFSWTYGGSVDPPVPGQRHLLLVINAAAEHKIEYLKYGALGWCAAIGMGVLCNWLVSLGSIMSKASRSTVGRAMLMWLPIGMFFALGFEHTTPRNRYNVDIFDEVRTFDTEIAKPDCRVRVAPRGDDTIAPGDQPAHDGHADEPCHHREAGQDQHRFRMQIDHIVLHTL